MPPIISSKNSTVPKLIKTHPLFPTIHRTISSFSASYCSGFNPFVSIRYFSYGVHPSGPSYHLAIVPSCSVHLNCELLWPSTVAPLRPFPSSADQTTVQPPPQLWSAVLRHWPFYLRPTTCRFVCLIIPVAAAGFEGFAMLACSCARSSSTTTTTEAHLLVSPLNELHFNTRSLFVTLAFPILQHEFASASWFRFVSSLTLCD